MSEFDNEKLAKNLIIPAVNVFHNVNCLNLVDSELRNVKYRALFALFKEHLTLTYEGENGSETFSHSDADNMVTLLDQVERFGAKCIRKYGIGKSTLVMYNRPIVRKLEWHKRAKDWRFVSVDHNDIPKAYEEIYQAIDLGCPPWTYDAKRHTSSLNAALMSMGVSDVLDCKVRLDITRTHRKVVGDRVELTEDAAQTYHYDVKRLGKIASLTRSWMRVDWLMGKEPTLNEVRFDIFVDNELLVRQYVFRIGNTHTGVEWMSRAIRVK